MSKIFYLMGKSASGKDTIYKRIREELPMLRNLVIYTTRPPREGEQEGVEYHFTDRAAFQEFLAAGKVIEYRDYDTVCGVWTYFTVDDGQFDKEDAMLAIGTPVSYRKLRDYLGAERVVPIYIEVEDGIRLTRALEREKNQKEPKYAELCRRFLADAEDFSEENLQTSGIDVRYENVEIEECVRQIVLGIQENLCYNEED